MSEPRDAHIARLTAQAERDPRGFRRGVVLLAAIGFTYIFGILALALWGLTVMIAQAATGDTSVMGVLFLSLIVIAVVRATIFLRVASPEGTLLTRRQAPALFAELDALRAQLRTPVIHEVRIDPELNAGVAQVPRLGMLGFPRNILVIGLPLIAGESAESFRATLAHELGHLAGGDSRVLSWLYRLRISWTLLGRSWRTGGWTAFVFAPFFQWFAPRFERRAFVLSRSLELQADRWSAKLVAPEAAVESLVRLSLLHVSLGERFWPAIERRRAVDPAPPADVYEQLVAHVGEAIPPALGAGWLTRNLTTQTGSQDTHPALAERLAALGAPERPALPLALDESAATAFLGDELTAELAAAFSARWVSERVAGWQLDHDDQGAALARLAELDRISVVAVLSADDRRERALLTLAHGNTEDAIPLLMAELEEAPDDEQLAATVGLALAAAGDSRAVPLLERVVAQDPIRHLDAVRSLRDIHAQAGDKAEADRWAAQLHRLVDADDKARAERTRLVETEVFLTHDLDDGALSRLIQHLRVHEDVAGAYLVRKDVTHLPERPCFVLGVLTTFDGRKIFTGRAERALWQTLQTELRVPGDLLVVVLNHMTIGLRGRMEQTPASRIL